MVPDPIFFRALFFGAGLRDRRLALTGHTVCDAARDESAGVDDATLKGFLFGGGAHGAALLGAAVAHADFAARARQLKARVRDERYHRCERQKGDPPDSRHPASVNDSICLC